jgi:hypothetical protein
MLSFMMLIVTDAQHNGTQHSNKNATVSVTTLSITKRDAYDECHSAHCRNDAFMLSVIKSSAIMLNVINSCVSIILGVIKPISLC